MAVTPSELECIPSDRLYILKHDYDGHVIRFQTKFTGPFIRAGGARAALAEISDGIDSLVAIAPRDTQHALLQPFHIGGFEHDLIHRSHRFPHRSHYIENPPAGVAAPLRP